MVANFVVSLHWFKNADPVIGSMHEPKDISRIRTVAIQEVGSGEPNEFYKLENVTEIRFITQYQKK